MTLLGLNVLLAQQQPMQADPTGQGDQNVWVDGDLCRHDVVFDDRAPAQKGQGSRISCSRRSNRAIKSSPPAASSGWSLSIKDKSVSIRSAETKLEILKSAVAEVTERGGESSETKS